MQGAGGNDDGVAKSGKYPSQREGEDVPRDIGVAESSRDTDRSERALAYILMAISGALAGALMIAGLGPALTALLATGAGCAAGWLARGVFK